MAFHVAAHAVLDRGEGLSIARAAQLLHASLGEVPEIRADCLGHWDELDARTGELQQVRLARDSVRRTATRPLPTTESSCRMTTDRIIVPLQRHRRRAQSILMSASIKSERISGGDEYGPRSPGPTSTDTRVQKTGATSLSFLLRPLPAPEADLPGGRRDLLGPAWEGVRAGWGNEQGRDPRY